MASNKQRKKISSMTLDLKELRAKASNGLGIVSTANNELLNAADNIRDIIFDNSKERSIESGLIPMIPQGNGLDWSEKFLTERGYDTNQITLDQLLTDEEIKAIEDDVNRPLTDRIKWDKWDYTFAFSAATMGVVADTMWGDPTKGLSAYLSNKKTLVGGWFDEIHSMHHSGSPLDYQGFKMGGGNHRLRSIGHDLFSFLKGIRQIKTGTFTGGYFQDGKWKTIITEYNQNGTPYETFSQAEAIYRYAVHVFCDFFSTKSLPVPGFGYLARMPIREVRKFADEMYKNGYNLRHMFVQALSIAIVEIEIRIYTHLRYRKHDISKESLKLKQLEMLMMAHCIVASINVGKVVILKNPLLLNLPQVLFTCYKFWPFILDHYRRNNRIQIILRDIDEIGGKAQEKYMLSLTETLASSEFDTFLQGRAIIL